METINHEYYVSLEIAKLLKEAGFNWKCINRYIKDTDLLVPCLGEANWNAVEWGMNDYKSAPTLTVAQKWLREVKDIDVYIFPTTNNKRGCVYEWGIKTFGRALWVEGQPYTNQYETYEEAQEAGIKKALELILEKVE